MCKAVVVGSLNLDTSITLERMPQPGETIAAQGVSLNPGGKGANQAFALGRLGCPVAMVGAVGRDAAGDCFTAAFALRLVEGETSLQAALEFANTAAALTASRPGAQASIPARDEVEALLAAR